MSNNFPIQIALTPRFQRDLRDLAKRYRSIRLDLQPLMGLFNFEVHNV